MLVHVVRESPCEGHLAYTPCSTWDASSGSELNKAGVSAVFFPVETVVTIYSDNEYQSYDLDFVSSWRFQDNHGSQVTGLGFQAGERPSLHSSKIEVLSFVEFPGTAATVGDEPIRDFEEIHTKAGALGGYWTPTYCVMDRLSAFYHWKDLQSLEQAVLVAKAKEPYRWNAFESGRPARGCQRNSWNLRSVLRESRTIPTRS